MSESILALLCLGFLGGTIVATVILGLVISSNKEQPDRNRGVDSSVSCRSGNGISYNRRNKQMDSEEMISVLQTLKMSASRYEKDAIDSIIDKIEGSVE